LRFGEQSFLEVIVATLAQICSPIVLVGEVNNELHEFATPVVSCQDECRESGPLEGIRVGLKQLSTQTEYAFVTSCDVPLLTPAVVDFLIGHIGEHDAVLPFQGQRFYGMTAIYRTSMHEKASDRIQQGLLRVSDLTEGCNVNLLPVDSLKQVDPQLDSLTNINSMDDYRRLLARRAN
jgi:molybdopterin-guanine dinucleotide biosynthesis protein A